MDKELDKSEWQLSNYLLFIGFILLILTALLIDRKEDISQLSIYIYFLLVIGTIIRFFELTSPNLIQKIKEIKIKEIMFKIYDMNNLVDNSIVRVGKKKVLYIYIYSFIGFIILIPFLMSDIFLLDFSGISILPILDLFYGKDISIFGGTIPISLILIFPKMTLFIILILSGYSMHNLIEKVVSYKIISFYAGFLYMINPYTYIRIMTGQLTFSYVMIPLLLKIFIDFLEKQQKKDLIKFIFLLSLVAFNIHMLIISLIIMFIIFMFWLNKYRDIRITKLFAMSGILFILLNSYWVIPVLTAKNTIVDNITDKDYDVFSPKGSLFDIVAMYGFWREGYIYAKDFIPGWQLLYLIILSLAIIGFLTYYKDEKIGYLVMAFGFVAILGLILALGIKGPLYPLYEFDNPILKGFRDSHKFVAMLVLSYSVLGGLGINKLEDIRRKICSTEQ